MKSEMMSHAAADGASQILTHETAPPVQVPRGHIGPVVLPGTGRMVWWTGRVAIGLRHQAPRNFGGTSQSALWLQSLMLQGGRRELVGA